MANISFKRGLSTALGGLAVTDGQFIVCTDTKELYTDVGSNRIKISDVEVVSAVGSLPDVSTAIKGKFYYAETENVFCFPFNGTWKQVNPDTGATSIEVVGKGNAVTVASYDASTRKITLTKGETFATPGVVDTKISNKVGELKIGDTSYATVKEYVDTKTADIASGAEFTDLKNRVDAAETDIDNLQTAIGEGGSVTLAIADAKKAGTAAAAAAATAQATADSKATLDEVKELGYATKTEAQGYADAKDTAIAAAKKAGADAQADVNALAGKVGTVADSTTVVGMINAMDTAYKAADTDLSDRITAIQNDYLTASDKTALQNQITTLVGEDAGKSARTIANEELAAQLIPENAKEALDTLGEIAAWIQSHPDDASAMNAAITKLEGILAGIGGDGEKATVVEYVTDAISALKIGDYAKAAELTALADRVTAIENKHISDGANKVEKSTTNGNIKIDGVDTVVYTHPAEHAISEITGLQGALNAKATPADITAEINKLDVEDTAVANQFVTTVSETDGKISVSRAALVAADIPELAQAKITGLTGALSNINTALGNLDTNKANKATTLAGYGITDAYTKTETYTKSEVEAMLTWGEF